MAAVHAERLKPRTTALAMAVSIHLLIAYFLVSGFALRVVADEEEPLKIFDVMDPAPPSEEPPATASAERSDMQVSATPAPRREKAAAGSPATVVAPARRALPSGQLARPAVLRSGAFHNDRDYPDAARLREEQGTVQVRYTIRANGRAARCQVVASSGSRSLDSITCRIIERRFRYSPALDRLGNPISEDRLWSITWRLI